MAELRRGAEIVGSANLAELTYLVSSNNNNNHHHFAQTLIQTLVASLTNLTKASLCHSTEQLLCCWRRVRSSDKPKSQTNKTKLSSLLSGWVFADWIKRWFAFDETRHFATRGASFSMKNFGHLLKLKTMNQLERNITFDLFKNEINNILSTAFERSCGLHKFVAVKTMKNSFSPDSCLLKACYCLSQIDKRIWCFWQKDWADHTDGREPQ